MKRFHALALVGATAFVAGCGEPLGMQSGQSTTHASSAPITPSMAFEEFASPGNHVHMMPTQANYAEANAKPGGGGGGGGGNTGIFYHGGPVILSPRVVAIYWANAPIYNGGPAVNTTGTGAQDGSLIGAFLRSLGGSPYWNINHTYFDGSKNLVNNSLAYAGFWATNLNVPASGSAPTDANMQALINAGFASGAITYDPSTIYEIFTASGVNLGGGFGSSYCAYHGHFASTVGDVKYAAEPYDFEFPTACAALKGSPNGDAAADAEVNTIAHETEEFTTDPDLNAWFDRRGMENADKCAWTFGTTYVTSNGSTANMNLGGNDYLVQRNWINSGSGGCRQSNP
jgi:hypothetical protein